MTKQENRYNQEQLMPLSMMKTGQKTKLVSINAGQGLKSRLTAMGLIPGVEVIVVNNSHSGPFVISVRGSRMMLGRGVTHKLVVLQNSLNNI
jgi:Fe2+ transport system protein FeoA